MRIHSSVLLCAVLLAGMVASTVSAATFTVNTTNDSGVNSLRWAITQANTNADRDLINFSIVPFGFVRAIQPESGLPTITNSVTIDGNTQSDDYCQPGIELDGSLAGTSHGLLIETTNCLIRGLVINRFSMSGISISSGGHHTVAGCYIGTDRHGTNGLGNGGDGINIDSSADNRIGLLPTSSCSNRNVISGNDSFGVRIFETGSVRNVLINNYIGTDVSGSNAIPNNYGVYIYSQASYNTVGTNGAAKPVNLISGNDIAGVYLLSRAGHNEVLGNYIGTTAGGDAALHNGYRGVWIDNSGTNAVGDASGGGNVISGNQYDGIAIEGSNAVGNTVCGNYIGLDAAGLVALSNSDHGVSLESGANQNTVGGVTEGAGNYISGNGGGAGSDYGVWIGGYAGGNDVFGNVIGLNASNEAVPNAGDGVRIENSASNNIGSIVLSGGNVISGNNGDGIQLGTNAFANVVVNNYIGTDTNGMQAQPNVNEGVYIYRSASNRVGSTVSTFNLISGNQGNGVKMGDNLDCAHNVIVGNRIGVNRLGLGALGNSNSGVKMFYAPSNTVGTGDGRNIISGNDLLGVYIEGSNATGNQVQNNYIGLNALGNSAIANEDGGVEVSGAPANVIGGTGTLGNVISGNGEVGVYVVGRGSRDNVVVGNRIGLSAAGTGAISNDGNGVWVAYGAGFNYIGTTNVSATNVIAGNREAGVRVYHATNNFIAGNSIFSNGLLGIDIDALGVSTNDDDDPDVGANMIQNYPVLFSATTGAVSSVRVSGRLNSIPLKSYRLEFFLNDAPDASGYGEGQVPLGVSNMTADADGDLSFYNFSFGATAAQTGMWVSATATDPDGNTSEFSFNTEIVGTELFDHDGDAMPSTWEADKGLDWRSAVGINGATGDPDSDLVENYSEYVADTDPWDSTNFLRVVAIQHPSNTLVTYASTNTRYYVVEYSVAVTNDARWFDLYSPALSGSNDQTTAEDDADSTNRFYRINAQLRR